MLWLLMPLLLLSLWWILSMKDVPIPWALRERRDMALLKDMRILADLPERCLLMREWNRHWFLFFTMRRLSDKSARIRASCSGAISHISNKAHTKLVRVLRMNLALFGAPATIRPTHGLSPTLPINYNCTKGSILPDYLRHLPQGDGKYFATKISLSIMRKYHQGR